MTSAELLQAIANLTRQNTNGRYDDRISAYSQALEHRQNAAMVNAVYKSAPEEMTAIMLFNKDRRFTITE
ncbi:hypothetical protein AAEO56_04700 [Flavobacterium sp. DGU11]|uniref:Uncharacterized protein n=1 Tax=Flavobacterium arundinis TaxID=3139143 RepID=A0ABU9HUC8_9FLAO